MTAAAEIQLRPVTEEDRPFLERVYCTTREHEMSLVPWTDEQKLTFLRQQFDAQWVHYNIHYGSGVHSLILANGRSAGRVFIERQPSEILIVDIALLPEHRGNGLGARVIAPILAEASRENLAVTGLVERWNPSCRFWHRMGFRLTPQDEFYYRIEWRSTDGQSTGSTTLRCESQFHRIT